MIRRLLRLLVVLGVVAILGIVVVWTLTNTSVGRRRSLGYLVSILQGQTHGVVRVAEIHGNLLSGGTLVRVSITDSAGHPFLTADSISGRYVIRSFFSQRLDFSDVVLYHPDLVAARLPGGEWNYRILWPVPPKKAPGDTSRGWGDWVRLTNVRVMNGSVTVRSPWSPRTGVTARARDSIIADVLSAGSRLYVTRVPGGFQKVVTVERLSATLPFIRWADPVYPNRFLQVSALATDAFPFRPPAAHVIGLTGNFDFNDDSLWWKGAAARLPHSALSGDGVYNLNNGDMKLALNANPATFHDFKWLYPHLPDSGGGTFLLVQTWKGATQDYVIRRANVVTGTAHVLGDVGVTIADTVFFHDANVHFTGVTTRLLEELSPGFKVPRQGVLAGRAQFAGTFKRLRLGSSDVTFDAYNRGRSRIFASGVAGFVQQGPKVVVSASDLHVRVEPLQIDLVKLIFPTLPVGGTLTGVATLNGSGDSQLRFTSVDIVHHDGKNASHAVGTASAHTVGRQTLDLDVDARPVALAELTKFAPSLPLKGYATGPIHAHGPIDALRVDTRASVQGGGQIAIRGTVDFLSKELGYDVVADATALNMSRVLVGGPVTSLSGSGRARGRGFKPATMFADVALELGASSMDTIGVDSVSLRAQIGRGLATIQRARVVAARADTIDVSGQIGMDAKHAGTLTYSVAVDSLATIARFIPGGNPADTTPFMPRPRAAFEALLKARADSARVAQETEVKRAVANAPPVTLRVPADTPQAIPRNLLGGAVRASGTITGSIDQFSLRGTATAKGLIVRGNAARHLSATYAWTDARTKSSALETTVNADTVSAFGFAFDSLTGTVHYLAPSGSVALRVRQGGLRSYSLDGDFTLDKARSDLRLADVTLRFDTTAWRSTHPSVVHWGTQGIEVVNFELRNGPNRRIYANGLLPTKGVANFDLDVTDFAVENVAELLQSDLPVTGRLDLNAHVTGTAEDPRVTGALDFAHGTYNATPVPELHGTFRYANRELTTDARAADSTGKLVASVNGTIPIDLRLSGVTGSRLLDLPIHATFGSDSLPLSLIPQFTSLVTDVAGTARGTVTAAGSLKRPTLAGNVALSDIQFRLTSTGTFMQHVNGSVRMLRDTVFVDSIAGVANGPVRLAGVVAVGNWREPAFDLSLNAVDAQLINNDMGEVHATANLRLTGAFGSPYASGQLTVVHGVLYIPDSRGKKIIGAGDPSLFSVVDTSVTVQRELFPAESRLFKNLRVDVDLIVQHDTWVRSRDANVEIFTDGPMQVHALGDALTLTGALDTDRGEYTFLSKRFQIKRGTALFIGTPDLNPTLQITAEYQVKQPQGVTNIRVIIGGTVETPRISLESDAQPALSQSDLLSYLAFGESSATLLQFNQTSLGGQQGNLLSVAGSRLAGVALGVSLDEIKGSAARSLGVDVFNITPGDIPVSQSQGGFNQFLKGTEIEAGRYVNPSTFVSIVTTPGIFACGSGRSQNSSCTILGASFTQRTSKGYRFEVSLSPRYLLDPPTLVGQTYRSSAQLGAFIIREWRF